MTYDLEWLVSPALGNLKLTHFHQDLLVLEGAGQRDTAVSTAGSCQLHLCLLFHWCLGPPALLEAVHPSVHTQCSVSLCDEGACSHALGETLLIVYFWGSHNWVNWTDHDWANLAFPCIAGGQLSLQSGEEVQLKQLLQGCQHQSEKGLFFSQDHQMKILRLIL